MQGKFIIGIGFLSIVILGGGFMYSPHAGAISNDSPKKHSIICGLWRGAHFKLNNSESCSKNPEPSVQGPQTDLYVALGDSVAAGLGLDATSNVENENASRCGRSDQAYGAIVAQRLSMPFINTACSGATAGDLVTKQGVDGPNIAAQLDTAFSGGTPTLMTITAGANDVHWDEFIQICHRTNCATRSVTATAEAYVYALKIKLEYAFSSIQNRSNGSPPHVILTGYYNPISELCVDEQQRITLAEVNWMSTRTAQLNNTIQDVASRYSFVHFASVDFTGHDVCSSDSWLQTADDVAPLHPTAQGQAAIAESVMAVYEGDR